MTSKERAYLRGMANTLDPVFQIGKGGISQQLLTEMDLCLEKRELIKVALLQSCEQDAREICDMAAEQLGAAPVQCIGRRFVIYRPSKDKPVIGIRV